MCGIAGFINDTELYSRDRETALNMLRTLTPRGPDENGIYTGKNACLVHTRLAVVDLEHGKQPLIQNTADGDVVLVYNGELYNTAEIKSELTSLGAAFKGYGDTEAVLQAYMYWGEDCVLKFNGIFAFAVYDGRSGKLFAARDRAGVKPFFYTERSGTFVFGSELKALLAHPLVKPEIDADGIAEIMLLGPGRTPGSGVFKGVFELKPGFRAIYANGHLRTERYFYLAAAPHNESFEDTVRHVRFLVSDAIKRQTVSDVPLCSFLSGGLDSSIIAALSGVKQTFSVGYAENEKYFAPGKFQPDSDDKYIALMTEFLGTEHRSVLLESRELADALYTAVDARDLPGMADVDSSLLLFCREVRKYATVALSGECADEVFGGYPWYRDKTIRDTDGFPWSQSTAYRASFLQEGIITGAVTHRSSGKFTGSPRLKKSGAPHSYVDGKYRAAIAAASKNASDDVDEARMKEMYNLNYYWFMQTLLDRKDRMSMYSSLEVRVPFCDHRITQYLYNVPWEFKDYNGREKGLLRYAVKGVLPDEILSRKKSPYPKTHHPEYLKIVSERLSALLDAHDAPLWKIVKPDAARALLSDNRATPWYGQLMTSPQTVAYLLQVNYWLEKFKITLV
ncbi:MAG: asparagine synthase (glutamine-hydrolyzing) [Clostridiaceae bacterium]|jgi:asparagine synthase (glutamine-hydrolysing)|nr:asparagine synthase (glutamine-hydrolyzing) [Clostridiaceae bacterium]